MARTLLIGALLSLVVGGCAHGSREPAPQQQGSASLRVKHVVDGSHGLYVEGSVWHVRVVDASGAAVLDRKLMQESVTVALDEGHYTLQSEEFPCDGNCSRLDPGADSCSAGFEVRQDVAATVTLKPGHGCSVAVVKSAGT